MDNNFIDSGYWKMSKSHIQLCNIGWNPKKIPMDIYVDGDGKEYWNYQQGYKPCYRMRLKPFARFIK